MVCLPVCLSLYLSPWECFLKACAADYTLCILAHAVPKSETPPLEVELLVVVAEENNLPQSVNASGEEVMELDKMWRIHRSLYPLTFKVSWLLVCVKYACVCVSVCLCVCACVCVCVCVCVCMSLPTSRSLSFPPPSPE